MRALATVTGMAMVFALGAWVGRRTAPTEAPSVATPKLPLVTAPAPAELQAAVDRAFETLRGGDAAAARAQFEALLKRWPQWTALRLSAARAAIAQQDGLAATVMLAKAEASGAVTAAQADYLSGLAWMASGEYPRAEQMFEQSTLADPTQADVYYLWGECLLREGNVAKAAKRFRQALSRNEYVTSISLIQAKIWIAEIAAGNERETEAGATIDSLLAKPNPPGTALIAGAAREVRDKHYAQAAEKLRLAKAHFEPPVFDALLADTIFSAEAARMEMAEFYQRQ